MFRAAAFVVSFAVVSTSLSADVTFLEDVRVFDGMSTPLSGPVTGLVRDGIFERFATGPGATVVGKTVALQGSPE